MLSKSKSLVLTSILVKVVFVLLIAAVFCIPVCVEWYDVTSRSVSGEVRSAYWPLMIALYASVAAAFPLVIALDRLVTNIKKGDVFVKANVTILHIMSYCCFAVSLIWLAVVYWRLLVFVVCFAAAFFGLILRVIKSVFEEAVSIKEENEGTI